MTLYASTQVRRTRQVVGDLVVLAWVVLAVWLGVQVHDGFSAVADKVDRVESASSQLSGGLNSAGDTLAKAPLLGDEIAAPFRSAAGSSDDIGRTGRETASSIRTLGTGLGTVLAFVLMMAVLPWYLALRIRFVVVATAVQRFRREGGDLDLLALRALTRQPVRRLVRLDPDVAARWREGDPATLEALARLEMRDLGVRLP